MGFADLGGAGGAAVGGVDAVSRAPHRDIDEQVRGRAALALTRPRRQVSGGGDLVGDLPGQVAHARSPGGQIGTPVRVFGQVLGHAGKPGQGSRARAAQARVVQAPVDDGGDVCGRVDLPHAGCGMKLTDRVEAVGGQQQQVRAQSRPGVRASQVGDDPVGSQVETGHLRGSEPRLRSDIEGVHVPVHLVDQLEGRVAGIPCGGGRRARGVVAAQDLFEDVGGGGRVGVVGSDHVVLVAIANDLEIEMVGAASPGERRVGQLPRLGAGQQRVTGVCSDPLGGVDRAGVAEFERCRDVGRRQIHEAPVLGVLDADGAVLANCCDGPTVAVLHPVGCRSPQGAVVGAGDDGVSHRGEVAIGEGDGDLGVAGVGLEAVLARPLVQLSDELAGGGEHDCVAATGVTGLPRCEDVVGHGGQVADVDAVAVQIETQCLWQAFAQGEGGCPFGRVGEAHELRQVQAAVGGLDVPQHPAGADG